jgi:hypothetical protein
MKTEPSRRTRPSEWRVTRNTQGGLACRRMASALAGDRRVHSVTQTRDSLKSRTEPNRFLDRVEIALRARFALGSSPVLKLDEVTSRPA